jgi:hypothetical protein
MATDDETMSFIENFSKYPDAKEMFTQGLCYWFAHILRHRFGGVIYYAPTKGHFVTLIGSEFYDITGCVTQDYAHTKLLHWDGMDTYDPGWKARIKRDCVDKSNYYPGGLWKGE